MFDNYVKIEPIARQEEVYDAKIIEERVAAALSAFEGLEEEGQNEMLRKMIFRIQERRAQRIEVLHQEAARLKKSLEFLQHNLTTNK